MSFECLFFNCTGRACSFHTAQTGNILTARWVETTTVMCSLAGVTVEGKASFYQQKMSFCLHWFGLSDNRVHIRREAHEHASNWKILRKFSVFNRIFDLSKQEKKQTPLNTLTTTLFSPRVSVSHDMSDNEAASTMPGP